MFSLQPSFNATSDKFIDETSEVVSALAAIHPSLTTQLVYEVILAANEKTQHVGTSFPTNALLAMWQFHISGFLREKLCSFGWTKVDGKGGVAYVISPCKEHAIRVFAGNKYVGLRDGSVSNKSIKGSTLKDDIYPLLNSDKGTTIWTLLHYRFGELMKLELSQPKSFAKGRIDDWSTRIKLPDIKFNIPTTPRMKDKVEVGVVPVKRKKKA